MALVCLYVSVILGVLVIYITRAIAISSCFLDAGTEICMYSKAQPSVSKKGATKMKFIRHGFYTE